MLMFTCIVCDVRETERTELPVNVSFAASKNSLDTNENSLETSLSAVKFRSNYHSAMKFPSNFRGVPRNFARTIAECRELSLSLKQQDSRNIVEKLLQT